MKKKNIIVVGGGTMGYAIAKNISDDYATTIVEKSMERRTYIERHSPQITCTSDHPQYAPDDLIILAIKPQDFHNLTDVMPKNAKYLSIIAGISLSKLHNALQSDYIARIMPSLTARISMAVTGYCVKETTKKYTEFITLTKDIASTLGEIVELSEKLIPAITALSGSGIAFVFRFIHELAMAGVAEGIPYPKSLEIAHDTILGAAEYSKQHCTKGGNPIELITQVCSPAGTTVAGLQKLDEHGFATALQKAVHAVVDRSFEIESTM